MFSGKADEMYLLFLCFNTKNGEVEVVDNAVI